MTSLADDKKPDIDIPWCSIAFARENPNGYCYDDAGRKVNAGVWFLEKTGKMPGGKGGLDISAPVSGGSANPDAWDNRYAADRGAAVPTLSPILSPMSMYGVSTAEAGGGGESGSLERFARRYVYHYEFAKRSTAGFRNDLFGSAVRSLIGENDWRTALRQTGLGLAVSKFAKTPIMTGLGVPTIDALFERSIIGGVGFDSTGLALGLGTRLGFSFAIGWAIERLYSGADTAGASFYAIGWSSAESW